MGPLPRGRVHGAQPPIIAVGFIDEYGTATGQYGSEESGDAGDYEARATARMTQSILACAIITIFTLLVQTPSERARTHFENKFSASMRGLLSVVAHLRHLTDAPEGNVSGNVADAARAAATKVAPEIAELRALLVEANGEPSIYPQRPLALSDHEGALRAIEHTWVVGLKLLEVVYQGEGSGAHTSTTAAAGAVRASARQLARGRAALLAAIEQTVVHLLHAFDQGSSGAAAVGEQVA